MVNKPHAPRSGQKSNKKPPPASANGEDTSYIVFSNSKDDKSKPSKAATGTTKSKVGGDAANQQEAEKKPDTRTLIAGPSWTGKLPLTLFNEHCQKQRWEKPEYTIRKTAHGHTGAVILRQKNTKTQEIITLPAILPPPGYAEHAAQPSAVEARHFAAAYALFRVSNAKNVHMMLPPQYRDLWKGDFQDLKSEAVAQGNGYLYEADPFLAKKQHEDAKAAKEKSIALRAKQVDEDKKQQVVSLDGQVQSRHILKGWQRVPKVEMGLKTRREVEKLIRSHGTWNAQGRLLRNPERRDIVTALSAMGFRASHIEEACEICRDRDECLEWLLVHVPEDDLPKWTLPDNYLAGVSLASGDVKREGKLKRLSAAGYAMELCQAVLDESLGNEDQAAVLLQRRLLSVTKSDHDEESATSTNDVWEEEQLTLESIFGDRYTKHNNSCSINLELQTPSMEALTLRARAPGQRYPDIVPVISIEANLPAYIRLSILKQCLLHAQASLIGEQMLFSIVDWLEQEVSGIIEQPGRLSEIASASSLSADSKNIPTNARVRHNRHPRPIQWASGGTLSQQILADWTARQRTAEQEQMNRAREKLPAWALQDAIVAAVTSHQVTIVSGETGSGKSTQNVQFILDDMIRRGLGEHANIICTQPRRISALGLADRVADERCSKVGTEVGFAIRGESKQQTGVTKICFVTTGVLLRRLQTSGGSTDDVVASLANVSHVVVDEVHERSQDTDFLLVLLRDVLKKRKDLRLVLMSATLDAAVFQSYFETVSTVAQVEIQGRTYPVQDVYMDEILHATGFGTGMEEEENDSTNDSGLDGDPRLSHQRAAMSIGSALRAVGTRINYDLIAQTVKHIAAQLTSDGQDGGILIFLPGLAEIDQTLRALRSMSGLHPLPLHAALPSFEQKLVFKRPPPGLRKVIAATNVAETSITIDDIVAVVDTGRVKETSFDPLNNMVRLTEVWASRAACKQRRGRAGRVRAGTCYKLYTRSAESKMAERPDPEIKRVPLEQLCLSVKAMGISDVGSFLASAITPPEAVAVEGALAMLTRMGALDANEITSLGWHLSRIPADLRCAKLMVYGAAFGCLAAAVTVASILTVKSPFISPQAKRDEAKAAKASFGDGQGDVICDLRAYEEFSRRRMEESQSSLRRWCSENYLNYQTMLDIATNRVQYMSSLQEVGFLPFGHQRLESTGAGNEALLRALIAGAFQPQLARIEFPDKKFVASSSGAVEQDPEARTIKYFNQENGRVFVHPSSTLFEAQGFPGNSVFMSYFTKMATSKVFIRDLTPFNVFSLLMFSGPIGIDPQGRGLVVDGWVRLRGWARIGVLVSRLRIMLDGLLQLKIEDPSADMSESRLVHVVKRLVELDGLDR